MTKKLMLSFLSFLLTVSLIVPQGMIRTVTAKEQVSADSDITVNVGDVRRDSSSPEDANAYAYVQDDVDMEKLLHHGADTQGLNTLAASYSLVSAGYVTPVKNQNPYGTCWTFAAMASSESGILKKYGQTKDLAELQLAYHFYKSYQVADPMNMITNDGQSQSPASSILDMGGNSQFATFALASGIGVCEESSYPYTSASSYVSSGTNTACYNTAYRLRSAKWFSMAEPDVVKQALLDYGALAVSYYHDDGYVRKTSSGGTAYYQNVTNSTNHAVTLVGWNDNYSKSNFKSEPSGNGAWLIKNSWGTGWGDSGYFWISYEDLSIKNGLAVFFELDTNSAYNTNNCKVYQYDGSASTNTRLSVNATTFYTGNIYTVAGDNEILSDVGFFAGQTNTDYTIIVYRNVTDKPSSGTKALEQTGHLSDVGYYLVSLDNPLPLSKNEKYSVIIKQYSPNKITAYVDKTFTMSGEGLTYNFYNNLTNDLSFYGTNGSYWTDVTTQYSATFRIKAVTRTGYTIKFVNDDNTVLQSSQYLAGATPVYSGATPTKASTAQYDYTFKGWSPTITAVTGNATYKATYNSTVRKYTIKFVNYNGDVLQSSEVAYGSTPSYTGNTPTKPSTTQYNYTFSGWSPTVTSVTGAATYTAQFSQSIRQYTIRFLNWDGSVLQSGLVNYGMTPKYNGATPTRPATAQYSYSFNGWTPGLTSVTGNADYTAEFKSTVNKYEIKFVNYDGTVLQEEQLEYGTTPVYRGETPVRLDDEDFYEFIGWEPQIESVRQNQTYTARFRLILAPAKLELQLVSMTTSGIYLQWTDISATSYEICRNDAVIPAIPDAAYLDDTVLRTMGTEYTYKVRANLGGNWTDYSDELTVVFNPFDDVFEDTDDFDRVAWAYNNDIVNGIGTSFKLSGNCTRTQFCIMLYKMAGKPSIKGMDCPFTDLEGVSTNNRKGIIWCYNKGIVNGTSATTFNPSGNITRAQLAIMVWKMAGQPKVTGMTCPYTDIDSLTANNKKAIIWCYNNGLINSITGTKFKPSTKGTRALLTEMLYGYEQIFHIVGN
ncbi:MAG: S-layer homology domain-containing protein [Erysipelotrichaceae bacterium]|nr:S-layer homology domain-containing protein [Erysipelotrichaceae bacterium]